MTSINWLGCLAVAGMLAGCATWRGPVAANVDVTTAITADSPAQLTAVNAEHRFVVADFGGQTVPAPGAELGIFRGDKAVGKIRVTEPMRGRFVTGDILEGDLRVGDVVR